MASGFTCVYLGVEDLFFSKLPKMYQVLCKTVGGIFFAFLNKNQRCNFIWQTVGDAKRFVKLKKECIFKSLLFLT
jgi:hypothetical protein